MKQATLQNETNRPFHRIKQTGPESNKQGQNKTVYAPEFPHKQPRGCVYMPKLTHKQPKGLVDHSIDRVYMPNSPTSNPKVRLGW